MIKVSTLKISDQWFNFFCSKKIQVIINHRNIKSHYYIFILYIYIYIYIIIYTSDLNFKGYDNPELPPNTLEVNSKLSRSTALSRPEVNTSKIKWEGRSSNETNQFLSAIFLRREFSNHHRNSPEPKTEKHASNQPNRKKKERIFRSNIKTIKRSRRRGRVMWNAWQRTWKAKALDFIGAETCH